MLTGARFGRTLSDYFTVTNYYRTYRWPRRDSAFCLLSKLKCSI
jgi:hypothetical protein